MDELDFIIIEEHTHTMPHSTRVTGVRTVKCPDCGRIFTQGGSGGCFTMLWEPMTCKCGFPWTRLKMREKKDDK